MQIADLRKAGRRQTAAPRLRAGQAGQAGRRRRDNAHCAVINYHLAFYLNVSISVICEFSMINAK